MSLLKYKLIKQQTKRENPMTTFFTPKIYESTIDMDKVSIMATSNTQIDGIDVFGWVDNEPYEAKYVDCPVSGETYAIAGDTL